MTTEDRLKKIERKMLAQHVRLNVQEVAISALIATHPDRNKLRETLSRLAMGAETTHLYDEQVTDEVREYFQQNMRLFIDATEP